MQVIKLRSLIRKHVVFKQKLLEVLKEGEKSSVQRAVLCWGQCLTLGGRAKGEGKS